MVNETARQSVQFIEIDEENGGQRVDNFLFKTLKGVPKSHIYRLLRRGEVRINGGRVKPGRKLEPGDTLRLPPIRPGNRLATEDPSHRLIETIKKSIIYEDNLMLIINKPAGVAVHGGSGVSAGVIEALRAFRDGDRTLELVHRLDRETSGCLMVARRRAWLRRVHTALRERQAIRKRYLAIVHGRWPKRRRKVDAPLAKNVLQSGERVSRVAADGKAALTRFTLLAFDGDYSLLAAEPVTGRTHQIRVHCSHAGCPIVGDPRYGDEVRDRAVRPARMMLHAASVAFPGGEDTGDHTDPELIEVTAPADRWFDDFVNKIKKYNKL